MRLRDVLASISLAAPLASCCIQEEIWHSREVELPEQPDAELAMLIQRCAEQAVCDPLCSHDWTEFSSDNVDASSSVRDCKLTIANGRRILTYQGLEICAAGRRPRDYRACPQHAATRIGAYLASQAALEAASIRAFVDLHADLVAHGCPRHFQQAAISAAADEIRHARICAVLARRYGATVRPAAMMPPAERRTIFELALDNVVEGCVRETFGAIVAGYQARAARDPEIRRAMRTIARDEAVHAELAWQVHRWLEPQLSDDERHELAAAALRARSELRASPSEVVPPYTIEVVHLARATDDEVVVPSDEDDVVQLARGTDTVVIPSYEDDIIPSQLASADDLARTVGLPDAHATAHMLDELDLVLFYANDIVQHTM